jgi:hypothetical protein
MDKDYLVGKMGKVLDTVQIVDIANTIPAYTNPQKREI